MVRRIRVLLLIPHLGGGGAEQVTALLARGLDPGEFEVHLGLATRSAVPDDLPRSLTVHSLAAGRVRFAALRLIRLVRRLRPAVVLSGMAHLNFLVLLVRPCFPRATRVLVRQNATVSSTLAADARPRLTRLLYRLLYPRADCVICQSQAMADDLAAQVGVRPERIAVLDNPLDLARIRAAQHGPNLWASPGPHLLSVGRLAPEKGFDLLLDAFATLRAEFPRADLVIAGEGSLRGALEAQARKLGLESAVHFPGYVDDPCRLFPGATLFVLSSRHEGMPNALLEAAAGGLPLVALPASGGVVELFENCPGAWLAESISAQALALALREALRAVDTGQRFERERMQRNGNAIASYEELVRATAQFRRATPQVTRTTAPAPPLPSQAQRTQT